MAAKKALFGAFLRATIGFGDVTEDGDSGPSVEACSTFTSLSKGGVAKYNRGQEVAKYILVIGCRVGTQIRAVCGNCLLQHLIPTLSDCAA